MYAVKGHICAYKRNAPNNEKIRYVARKADTISCTLGVGLRPLQGLIQDLFIEGGNSRAWDCMYPN